MGATYIEKHLTLARSDGGPDADFSLEPLEFAAMVKACRTAASARGAAQYGAVSSEHRELRRSLYVSADMLAGQIFTLDNVRTARPAHGMSPAQIDKVLGRAIGVDAKRGTPITMDLIA